MILKYIFVSIRRFNIQNCAGSSFLTCNIKLHYHKIYIINSYFCPCVTQLSVFFPKFLFLDNNSADEKNLMPYSRLLSFQNDTMLTTDYNIIEKVLFRTNGR